MTLKKLVGFFLCALVFVSFVFASGDEQSAKHRLLTAELKAELADRKAQTAGTSSGASSSQFQQQQFPTPAPRKINPIDDPDDPIYVNSEELSKVKKAKAPISSPQYVNQAELDDDSNYAVPVDSLEKAKAPISSPQYVNQAELDDDSNYAVPVDSLEKAKAPISSPQYVNQAELDDDSNYAVPVDSSEYATVIPKSKRKGKVQKDEPIYANLEELNEKYAPVIPISKGKGKAAQVQDEPIYAIPEELNEEYATVIPISKGKGKAAQVQDELKYAILEELNEEYATVIPISKGKGKAAQVQYEPIYAIPEELNEESEPEENPWVSAEDVQRIQEDIAKKYGKNDAELPSSSGVTKEEKSDDNSAKKDGKLTKAFKQIKNFTKKLFKKKDDTE